MAKMVLEKYCKEIRCDDASEVFSRLYKYPSKAFLLESRDVSQIYGRLSLIGIDPILEIKGKNEIFFINSLNSRAQFFLSKIKNTDLEGICDNFQLTTTGISGIIKKKSGDFEENKRTKRKNISQIIRLFLAKFKQEERELLGLYGAFSYDFIRLFEEIPKILKDEGVDDFRLCLYDTFVFFDHLKDKAEVITYRKTLKEAEKAANEVCEKIVESKCGGRFFDLKEASFDLKEEHYKELVEKARDLARRGELFEVVYSNTLKATFDGDPFALYQKYREANPSPYLFFFDFEEEQLIGASPEMMIRCENSLVHLRPISGTVRRGVDPIEDHENMVNLLTSQKERAELDMLIDLGRNDLARICKPGIKISDYRFVEKYSKVMHTVAHLTGRLRSEFIALDALIACLNAGTLTGAPKVAAMVEIEKNENSRRGYYGGSVGYLSFSGNMDMGIIIRTAHIKNEVLSFRVGATLLYDSEPESEYQETLNKAKAFCSIYQ